MSTWREVRALLSEQPKETLGFYPTPLQKLERISSEMGVNLFSKREDFSGISLFGGNKIRKLEYLLGDAKRKGCDTVITYGATQSNHAMETATACRRCGLTPVLFLVALVKPGEKDIRANLLLDHILGAQIHLLEPLAGESTGDTFARCADEIKAVIDHLKSEGHCVYDMPVGGSTEVGVRGYIDAYAELLGQMEELGVSMDYLFTATGSGGTMAGLSAGKVLCESDASLIGIGVSQTDMDSYIRHIADLGSRTIAGLGRDEKVTVHDFAVDGNYYLPGYEMPSAAANADIRYLARREGIFTDPVYSGKGFYGMMEYIREGKVPTGSTVVFLHTGGATALFSEPEIVGDLASM